MGQYLGCETSVQIPTLEKERSLTADVLRELKLFLTDEQLSGKSFRLRFMDLRERNFKKEIIVVAVSAVNTRSSDIMVLPST